MTRLVLASKSAARATLLKNAGVTFISVGAGVDEDIIKSAMLRRNSSPAEIARTLAEEKAKTASLKHDGLVIGADQTLDLDGALIDKVDSLGEARTRLTRLRGRAHRLHSAVAVARAGELVFTEADSATLFAREFTDAWLDGYLDRNGVEILGSVGCYMLEGEGAQIFDRVEGDYFTILGLPLLPLLRFLRAEGALAA
ncbi:MAG TPA: Maf family protein [Caulobacteraceae bacterium]|jgi:septum formation protein|nr:Maf family protein [Caulobacteraceae bacterium]